MTTEVLIREETRQLFEHDLMNGSMGFNFIEEVPLPGFNIHRQKLLRYNIWPTK